MKLRSGNSFGNRTVTRQGMITLAAGSRTFGIKKANRVEPKDNRRMSFKDLPNDALHRILGAPSGRLLRRRDLSDSYEMRGCGASCNALYKAYKGMYESFYSIDLTVPNSLESYPVMPLNFREHVLFMVTIIGPNLRSLKIQQSLGHLTQLLITTMSTSCLEIREISFSEGSNVPLREALAFLNKSTKLRSLEVSEPGPPFMLALEACETSIEILSLQRMREHVVVNNVANVLFHKGSHLKQLFLGEEWSYCFTQSRDCGLRFLFRHNGHFVLNLIRSVRKLVISVPKGCCVSIGNLIDVSLIQRFTQIMSLELITSYNSRLFCQEAAGNAEKPYERNMRIEDFLDGFPEPLYESFEEAYPDKKPEGLQLSGEMWSSCYSSEEHKPRLDGLLRKIKPSIRSIVILRSFRSPAMCRIVCEMLRFFVEELPMLETLHVSYEIVAYTSSCSHQIAAATKKMKNLKGIYLICHFKTHHEYNSRVGYARFVRNLSPFLSFLQRNCTSLEVLAMERGNRFNSSLEESTRDVLLRSAIKRVDAFEANLPSVDASTVREQLHSWQRESRADR